MSVREDLRTLVQLQTRELEIVVIDAEIAEVERTRAAARAEIDAANAVVAAAGENLETARGEARRLDMDLKSAEEKVAKFKDQMHAVKTNQELWAIQEEIGHAQQAVGDVETEILEQLEVADALDAVIGEKTAALVGVNKRVDAAIAEADSREAELAADKARVGDAVEELDSRVPADLLNKYHTIRRMRARLGVSEAYEETCMACNVKIRPQLFVEASNLNEIQQCENCSRILYVAETLGLQSAGALAEAERAEAVAAAAAGDAGTGDAAANAESSDLSSTDSSSAVDEPAMAGPPTVADPEAAAPADLSH